eukprot:TRINITY_DN6455_c1_g1_i4.p2 TRINITY_DN6455_c1_g1~~TRINITY_DN6455_c1_g1_i4.p2  ORF type:complete len:199 (-),score=51.28 TRINITY_DN6455_c1_g1_i4:59-655(-)
MPASKIWKKFRRWPSCDLPFSKRTFGQMTKRFGQRLVRNDFPRLRSKEGEEKKQSRSGDAIRGTVENLEENLAKFHLFWGFQSSDCSRIFMNREKKKKYKKKKKKKKKEEEMKDSPTSLPISLPTNLALSTTFPNTRGTTSTRRKNISSSLSSHKTRDLLFDSTLNRSNCLCCLGCCSCCPGDGVVRTCAQHLPKKKM